MSGLAARRADAGWPSGSTELVGVIGDPVRHSASPAIHNAAFAHLGMDWACVAFPVRRDDGAAAVLGAKAMQVRGLAVTMPLKQLAAELADHASSTVERLSAANTLVFSSGSIEAESTDGAGFLDDLRQGGGFEPTGRRCAVIGAGGAARAVVLALAGAGAAAVLVLGRSPERARAAAELAGRRGAVAAPGDLGAADLVVNATPVGMAHMPTGFELPGRTGDAGRLAMTLRPGQLCYDLVYHPAETPLLEAARRRGAATRNGLGMLVHQAARQFRLFTGCEPPLEVMWQAVTAT